MSYLIFGGDVILKAVKNIFKGQVFDENLLMTIATIGAFIIGEFAEGVAVMLFFQVGELFQSIAVDRSRKSITDLMDIKPDYANLKIGDNIEVVNPSKNNSWILYCCKTWRKKFLLMVESLKVDLLSIQLHLRVNLC